MLPAAGLSANFEDVNWEEFEDGGEEEGEGNADEEEEEDGNVGLDLDS